VCLLTMRIFPDCFVGEIVYVVSRDSHSVVFGGPTAYGAFLLLLRNGLFAALTVWVAHILSSNSSCVPSRERQEDAILPSGAPRPTIRSAV
jgi:hypothetical protein